MFEEHEIDYQMDRLRKKAQSLGVTFREYEFDRMAQKFGFWQTMAWTDNILDRLRTLRHGNRCSIEKVDHV